MNTCEYCKNAFDNDKPIRVVEDSRLHLFCSQKCKDEWACLVDPDNCFRFF